MTYETPTGANMFAYCMNNPVSMVDDGGEWAHLVIGATVGAMVSAAVTAATSYAQTGSVDWRSVAINAASGAVGGLIAATGLGAGAQAALTAVASGAGNYIDQVSTKGRANVNMGDVMGSAIVGGATSLMGSAAGKLFAGNVDDAGQALLSKGKDKLLTGYINKSFGHSHSALIRQGRKLVDQGNKMIHTYRGTSSVIGSLIGGGTGVSYNAFKATIGW